MCSRVRSAPAKTSAPGWIAMLTNQSKSYRDEGAESFERGWLGKDKGQGWRPHVSLLRSTRPGFPATVAFAGTSLITTAPAPTSAHSPMVTPHKMVTPLPMLAPRLTVVGTTFQSGSVCNAPLTFVARGYLSLTKMTP